MKPVWCVVILVLLVVCQNSEAGKPKQAAGKPSVEVQKPSAPTSGTLGTTPDPLALTALPPGLGGDLSTANTLPPYQMLHSTSTVSPNLATIAAPTLNLDIDRRIKQAEDLMNRMVWQLNRETSWANSVHDIIQNYQYKYTKVLANIKKHSKSTNKMRELVTILKKARLHEILEADLSKATDELQELASSSKKTSTDEGSYAALKDRASLIKQDLAKMGSTKVNKILHGVQEKIKKAALEAVPKPSTDTLKQLGIKKK